MKTTISLLFLLIAILFSNWVTNADNMKTQTMNKVIWINSFDTKFLSIDENILEKIKDKELSFKTDLPKWSYYCKLSLKWCYLKKDFLDWLEDRMNSFRVYVYLYKYNIKRIVQYKLDYWVWWKDISKQMFQTSIQNRSLSCESSWASDIISELLNKKVTEDEIIEKLEKTSDFYWKLPEIIWNNKYWWDPDEWFVWYIDKLPNWQISHQYNMTWYWVHEKPLIPIYESYWLEASYENEFSDSFKNEKEHLKKVLREFNNWTMIQLWWDFCTDIQDDDWIYSYKNLDEIQSVYQDWKTIEDRIENQEFSWTNTCKSSYENRILNWKVKSSWKEIKWLSWEHNFYLLWYKWDFRDPTHIIVWDTFTWRHEYKTHVWLEKWSRMNYRTIYVK